MTYDTVEAWRERAGSLAAIEAADGTLLTLTGLGAAERLNVTDVRIARGSTRTLGLLAGAAALAMLIAFANLVGLLLVRSIDRRRELAVRTALGARRSEIARQLVLEAETLVRSIDDVAAASPGAKTVRGGVAVDEFNGDAQRSEFQVRAI